MNDVNQQIKGTRRKTSSRIVAIKGASRSSITRKDDYQISDILLIKPFSGHPIDDHFAMKKTFKPTVGFDDLTEFFRKGFIDLYELKQLIVAFCDTVGQLKLNQNILNGGGAIIQGRFNNYGK